MCNKDAEHSVAYVWFDSEFTSLNYEESHLLQVAVIVTDRHLKRILPAEQDINISVALPADAVVSPWVEENIPAIVERSRSSEASPVEEVDRLLCERLEQSVGAVSDDIARRPVLAGNSIHADLQMIRKWLPAFASQLHYRLLDVTAWKLGWSDWFEQKPFDKKDQSLLQRYMPDGVQLENTPHDAYFDVCASIAEYKYYVSRLKAD